MFLMLSSFFCCRNPAKRSRNGEEQPLSCRRSGPSSPTAVALRSSRGRRHPARLSPFVGLSSSFLAQKRPATPSSSLYECSAGKIERFRAEIGSGEPPEAPVGTRQPGAPLTLLSLFPFVVVGNDRRGPPRNCCDRPLYLFVLGLKVGLLVRGRLPLAWFFAS